MAWIFSSLGDQKLDACWPQFLQIYLEGWCLYGFDRQRVFGIRYMAGNLSASREHVKHDENNVEHGGNTVTKR